VALNVYVVVTLGVTFCVPFNAVERTVEPLASCAEVAAVVVHVRSKPPPVAGAEEREQVGPAGNWGTKFSAFEQVPPGDVAVKVKVVGVFTVTVCVPDGCVEVNVPPATETVVAPVVSHVRLKSFPVV
jgi:hypothetical protein